MELAHKFAIPAIPIINYSQVIAAAQLSKIALLVALQIIPNVEPV